MKTSVPNGFSACGGPRNPETGTKHASYKSFHDFHLTRSPAVNLQLNVISPELRTKMFMLNLSLGTTGLNVCHLNYVEGGGAS